MAPGSVILHEDEHWLIVNKPYGIATHGGDPGDVGVQEWLALHHGKQLFVCSRLDKGTTGVLLFAKTSAASSEAERIHVGELSEKTYYFLSDKDVRTNHGQSWICTQPLDDKSARTEFFFDTQIAENLFRYRALIARGRTHQIRRHAAHSGCPLWGDTEYGGKPAARIALHCFELKWPGIASTLRAPLPHSFSADSHALGASHVEGMVALERRGNWMSSITSAWRAVQRGELSRLDLSIDVYGKHLLVWVYDEASFEVIQGELQDFFLSLQRNFGLVGIVFRRISKNPHKQGLIQERLCVGIEPPELFEVEEHEWKAWVTLTARQHVGLFLDHRDNRRRLQLVASGKRIANLFSYTCAFGIVASKAGCEVVMNVDSAGSTLAIGKKNFELNALVEARTGKFVERDARVWLQKQVEKKAEGTDQGWDIIVCDPPTFSSTREGGAFHVGKEWIELSESCARILKADGVCWFSTNCQAQERAAFEKGLLRVFRKVQRLRPPMDFPEIAGRSHAWFFECREPSV
ncbi:MAG: pseudouridine synthase [Silvanigrellaceae bacterium]